MRYSDSLVKVVSYDKDSSVYTLACGHKKIRVHPTKMIPNRTQCRECFPDAPFPGGWWSRKNGATDPRKKNP